MTVEQNDGRRCALIVGHPGHELRVWGWMRAVAPRVAVLTDGSGHTGEPRLALTRRICEDAGAVPGPLFGLVTDAAVYRALVARDAAFFLDTARRLADWLIDDRIDVVAGDAHEGYNPTHDMCRALIDRAVRLAARDRPIENLAFDLTGAPGRPLAGSAVHVALDREALARKLAVCEAYGRQVGGTLLAEIDAMRAQHGDEPFAHEYLQAVDAWQVLDVAPGYRPYYETYGERQVAAGHYDVVIRHDEHVRPVVDALRA